jgi:hypothetical protein
VIKNYGFQSNIGFFMGDNADSNNHAVDAVLRALYPSMSAEQWRARRLRCFRHIVNLYARDFII